MVGMWASPHGLEGAPYGQPEKSKFTHTKKNHSKSYVCGGGGWGDRVRGPPARPKRPPSVQSTIRSRWPSPVRPRGALSQAKKASVRSRGPLAGQGDHITNQAKRGPLAGQRGPLAGQECPCQVKEPPSRPRGPLCQVKGAPRLAKGPPVRPRGPHRKPSQEGPPRRPRGPLAGQEGPCQVKGPP